MNAEETMAYWNEKNNKARKKEERKRQKAIDRTAKLENNKSLRNVERGLGLPRLHNSNHQKK